MIKLQLSRRLAFLIASVPISLPLFSQVLNQQAQHLNLYYELSHDNEDSLFYRKLFFNEFPNSFPQFLEIYGYQRNENTMLADKAYYHVCMLFDHLECIDDTVYMSKLINLAIDGKWNADAVHCLQKVLRKHFLENGNLAFAILSTKQEGIVKNVFYFFFDGLYSTYQVPPAEFQQLEHNWNREYQIMIKVLDEVNLEKNK